MVTQRSVVKWFDAKKGYGFIVHPQGGADIFVHYSQIDTERRFKTLRTGQVVEYQLEDGPKGLHAVDVLLVEEQRSLPEPPSPSSDYYHPHDGRADDYADVEEERASQLLRPF